MLETERLILRPWTENDAEDLYKYASDPDVGPAAGWPAHRSVEESLDAIRNIFMMPEKYAICLKGDDTPIGNVSMKMSFQSDLANGDDECEIGYWLGKPFWGQGIMTEAVREVLRHAFEDIGMNRIWIGYFEGNDRSRRVQEKCGFIYQRCIKDSDVTKLNEKRDLHVSLMTKEDWFQKLNDLIFVLQ